MVNLKAIGILVIIVVLFLNLGYIIYITSDKLPTNFSGNAVKNYASESYNIIPLNVKYFLIIEISSLGILMTFLVFSGKFTKHKSHELNYKIKIEKMLKNSTKTDMDIFYDLLKTHKEMSLREIMKSFNINKEAALEWGRILEASELVNIEYPAFGSPIISLKEVQKPKEDIQIKKTKVVEKK